MCLTNPWDLGQRLLLTPQPALSQAVAEAWFFSGKKTQPLQAQFSRRNEALLSVQIYTRIKKTNLLNTHKPEKNKLGFFNSCNQKILKSIQHRLKKTGELVFFFSIFLESPKGWFFFIWYVYFLSNVCGNSMEFLTMKKLGLYDC